MSNLSSIKVPHYGPSDAKILFIGEAPGEDEENQSRPFVGKAGQRLRDTLMQYGYNPEDARYANLCNYRPQHNNFNWCYNTPQFEEGKRELSEFILSHRPNVIVPLGKEALNFITGKKSISVWRGSIIPCTLRPEIKCIPTYHPSYVERDQTNIPPFSMDIGRIINDSKFSDFGLTPREYIVNPKGLELEKWVQVLLASPKLGTDIESVKDTGEIICVGFAPSPNLAVCIFTDSLEGKAAIHRILSGPSAKIFHFGIFDSLMLLYKDGYEINNYLHDTYIGQRIVAPEQPNSLAYLTSIYTREPYYKDEGRAEIPKDTKVWSSAKDKTKLGIYNCKDCCVTIESHIEQMKDLEEFNLMRVYEDNMDQQEMAIHISMSGMLIDEERRHLLERALLHTWKKWQGALNFFCKEVVNVNSPKLKNTLYGKLGLPERKKRDKHGNWKVTTDEDALVASVAYCKTQIEKTKDPQKIEFWEIREMVCGLIIKIRGIRKNLSSYIKIKSKANELYGLDYRARSTFKVGGAETLRYSAEMFVDDTGVNGQTFPREAIVIPEDIDQTDSAIISLLAEAKSDENQIESELTIVQEAA